MKRAPKPPKIPSAIRSVLAENLRKLLERDLKSEANKPLALREKTGLGQWTIQRAINGTQSGSNIDTIEVLAKFFGLAVYQLLIPELDVFTPQSTDNESSGLPEDLARAAKGLSAENLPRLIGYADSLLAAQDAADDDNARSRWQTIRPWDGRERRKNAG